MNNLIESIVNEISKQIIESYIDANVAKQCAKHLSMQLMDGIYDVSDLDAVALQLTKDLQDISHDKHLGVRRKSVSGFDRQSTETVIKSNYGFRKLEILNDNIGYIDLLRFYAPILAAETTVSAMRFVANTDALIIDLRQNGGGDPNLVVFICTYFFRERTHLNDLYWRSEDSMEQFWTLPYVPGPLYTDKPLYILTSSNTFSAAEEFCYNLKNLNRARIIGEVTRGGAHPGGWHELPGGFEIFVPCGKAINPISKDNWEGKGVIPHVKTSADDALDVALREIRSILNQRGK